jgi:hypothetical protein
MRTLLLGSILLTFPAARPTLAQPPAPSAPSTTTPATATAIPVRVSTRVELLSIVFQLAGAPEYNQLNAQSPYAQRAQLYFREFAGHDAVKLARDYRKKFGVSHDAVMSYAIHLVDNPGSPLTPLEPKIPFDLNPPRLDKRWNGERAKAFLEALNRFAVESKAEEFFKSNQPLYDKAATRLTERVNGKPYRAWLDSFFGAKAGAEFTAIPGMLNGGSNYGVGVLHANGREEVLPVIGVHKFDAEGVPVFEESDGPTIVHEFCHSFTNPLVDKNIKTLLPSFEKLFPTRANVMRQQAYAGPREMAYETLVRACTVRYAMEKEGKDAGAAQLADERARGFLWTGELVDLMSVYQLQRDKYPTFESFMPEVVALFAKLAEKPEEQAKKVPTVKRFTPDLRAGRIDVAATEIEIEFDRPMTPGGFSFVGDPKQMPKATGSPVFSSDGRRCTLPVKLETGKRYTLRMNSLQHHGFTSLDGYALDPLEVSFSAVGK